MKSQRSKPLAEVRLPFREIPLERPVQTPPDQIRIIHRKFTIELPVSIEPSQLAALVRGLA